MTAIVDEHGALLSEVPNVHFDDPASLEAMYGNYSFFDHYRKVVLASCEEVVRGRAAADGEKITEKRIEALARLHPNYYLDFLAVHYEGRSLREKNVCESMVGR